MTPDVCFYGNALWPVIGTVCGLLDGGVDGVTRQPQEAAVRPQADAAPLLLGYVAAGRIEVAHDDHILKKGDVRLSMETTTGVQSTLDTKKTCSMEIFFCTKIICFNLVPITVYIEHKFGLVRCHFRAFFSPFIEMISANTHSNLKIYYKYTLLQIHTVTNTSLLQISHCYKYHTPWRALISTVGGDCCGLPVELYELVAISGRYCML